MEMGRSQEMSEEKKRILRERAKRLAQEPKDARTYEREMEVLEFLLGRERYAVETEYVREVYPMKELTVLPCTPDFLLGIVNIRGEILPVIDVKKFFDLPGKGITNLNKVIVVRKDPMAIGILSDEVINTYAIPLSDLTPPPPILTGIKADFLKGITHQQLILIDIEKIISDKRLIIHEEIE